MVHIFWKIGRRSLFVLSLIALALPALAGPTNNVQLKITITNNQTASNSLAFGPVFFGFHDGSFDPFNVGDAGTEPSGGVTPFGQAVIDAGSNNFSGLQNLFTSSSPNGGTVAYGNARDGNGVFNPNESDDFSVIVDLNQNSELFIFTRVLPSNDAFAATDTSLSLANIMQNGSVTFTITRGFIFDAAATNQNPDTADYVIDPGSANRGFGDAGTILNVEDLEKDYFSFFDGVILPTGEVFAHPNLGAFGFVLGTITIEFIAVVSEPAPIMISALGLLSLAALRRRQRRNKQKLDYIS